MINSMEIMIKSYILKCVRLGVGGKCKLVSVGVTSRDTWCSLCHITAPGHTVISQHEGVATHLDLTAAVLT